MVNQLLCNISGLSTQETADGLEATFGVNHVAHQFLAELLLDRLAMHAPSRVVVVSSWHGAALFSRAAPAISMRSPATFSPFGAYGDSKLANVLFAQEFGKLYRSRGVTSYSLHPGMVHTALGVSREEGVLAALNRWGSHLFWWALAPVTKSPAQAAATLVSCSCDPALAFDSGFFYDSLVRYPLPLEDGEAQAARLWGYSQQLIAAALSQQSLARFCDLSGPEVEF